MSWWMQLIDGEKLTFDYPSAIKRLGVDDIAKVLSRIPRFGGHTTWPYTVAQHSVLVMRALPSDSPREWKLWALLHDVHEIATGDVIHPLKKHFASQKLATLATAMDVFIAKRFGVDLSNEKMCDAVHRADSVMLATEARDLMLPAVDDWVGQLPPPVEWKVEPWHPEYAADRLVFEIETHLPMAPTQLY